MRRSVEDENPPGLGAAHDGPEALEQARLQLAEARFALEREVAVRRALEAAQRTSFEAQMAVLDALPAHIAVVDARGAIAHVNEAWRRYATRNELHGAGYGVGCNYVEVCERAVAAGSEEAREAAAGLRRVLRGDVDAFVFDYACPSPGTPSAWFRLTISPLHGDGVSGAVVMHLDITERRLQESELRLAERTARESEQRLGFALEAAEIGDWTLDLRTNVFYRSLRHDQCFGYAEPVLEWGYETFLAHVDPVDREQVDAGFQRALTGKGEYDHEFRTTWRDGSTHWLWMRGRFYFDDAGTPYRVAGIVADITERRRTEESLRASEVRFAEAFDHAPIGVALVSMGDRFLKVNRALCELVGRAEVELLARTFEGITHPDDIEESRQALRRLTAGEVKSIQIEKRYVHAEGHPVTALKSMSLVRDQQGLPSYFIAQIQDITERKRAEKAVERALERLSEAQRVGRIGDWEWDLESQRITWSPQVFEIVGRPNGLGPPRNDAELATLLDEPSRRLQQEAVERALATGDAQDYELAFVHPSGALLPAQVLAVVRKDEQGRVLGMYGTLQDVSARKTAEAALRRSEEQLRQVQKMEAVGQLAGGIAHDFNNLLSVILSYCTLVLEELKPDDPIRADIEEVRRAGQRATELTRQLLAFSRQQVLQPRVLDVNQVILGMEKMLRRLLGEGVELSLTPGSALGKVHADPTQIEQILMNLAVNARDAMPSGGKLSIETVDAELGAADVADHPDVVPGRYVRLAITDTGSGIDALVRERIFEPFFTTKEQGKGTGLGLSTVFGIVKQSRGHIRVTSAPSEGTTFEVYLPRTDRVSSSDAVPPALPVTLRGSETILLVEDEEQVRVVTRTILRQSGYTVIDAQNAGEAFLICETHPREIHLLLTDVIMPRMSGRELAARLAPMRPTMRVLYMSGYTEDSILREGVLVSGIDFLQKPITPDRILQNVREVLDRS